MIICICRKAAFTMVDELCDFSPPLQQDHFFDDVNIEIEYTPASEESQFLHYLGSAIRRYVSLGCSMWSSAVCSIPFSAQRRGVATSVACFQRRPFVCLFVNTIISERVNVGWWNLRGGRCSVQKSRPSSGSGVIAPLGAHPKNVALGYDRWANQHRLSSSFFLSFIRPMWAPWL